MELLSHGFHFRLHENQLHFLLRKIFHPLSKKVDTVEHPQVIHRTSHQIAAYLVELGNCLFGFFLVAYLALHCNYKNGKRKTN